MDSHRYTDTYSNAHPHIECHPDMDAFAITDCHAYITAYHDAYFYSSTLKNLYCDSGANGNRICDRLAFCFLHTVGKLHANAHAHTSSHADAHCHAYSSSYSHSDIHAEPRALSHTHAHVCRDHCLLHR
jgi:hypothetical protein